MRRQFYILMFLLATTFSTALRAQNVEAFASVDSTAIMIGDQVNYEIGISMPDDYLLGWPQITDTLTSHIEVLGSYPIDTLSEPNQLTLRQRLRITSFDSGFFEVPPVTFLYRQKDDTTIHSAITNKLFLQVYTPLVDTAQDFKVIKGPIREPYTFREILPWLLLALVVAVLIGLLVLYLTKRKKNHGVFVRKSKPLPPPHVTAIKKLDELRLAKIWQQGRLKLYYSQLTDIIREYMEGRFHFDAPEMTTDEILEALKKQKINKEVMDKLGTSLQLADLVKFAKAQPTALENDLSLDHCIDFVNETKAKVAEENGNTDDVQPQTGESK
ncbi:MAG: hypothetical protein L3J31_04890 [Bacteroidales bacterium]|nr:hypothetical protein [Bacteroidales bacterium]